MPKESYKQIPCFAKKSLLQCQTPGPTGAEGSHNRAQQSKWAWNHGSLPVGISPCNTLYYPQWPPICHICQRMGSSLGCSVLVISACRFNRELAEVVDENDGSKYQSIGVVNIQAQDKVTTPALSNLPLGQVHIYFPIGYLDVIFPKLTSPPYRMKMDVRQYGHKTLSNPPNLAQTVNHHTLLPAARMPGTPVCNEIYAAGLMNPLSADRLWYTNRCSIKLAVTMFKAAELECCLKSLSCHVPEPSPPPCNTWSSREPASLAISQLPPCSLASETSRSPLWICAT